MFMFKNTFLKQYNPRAVDINHTFLYTLCVEEGAAMNYKQLSFQYFIQYKLISIYLKDLKHQVKCLDPSDERELKRRINILYAICLDLKHTSEYLKKCERREAKNE